ESAAALSLIDRALARFPRSASLHASRGRALAELMRQQEAIEAFDRALTLERALPDVLNQRGLALVHLGRFDQAIECYERALAAGGSPARVAINIVEAKTFKTRDDPHLILIERLQNESEGLSHQEKMLMHFAAGKMCDDLGKYDDAFAH